jgi:crossover junction endodeoxyribonuclease RuvC
VRILGVDPGLTRCGLGVIEAGASRRVSLVDVVVAESSKDDEAPQRLLAIAAALDAVLDAHKPEAIALERVFSQHNVRTVMGTAQASGVVMLAAARRGTPLALYTPSEVKAAVTGNGRAPKAQVGEMVRRMLGDSVPDGPADAADALAIAICHAWKGAVPGAAGRDLNAIATRAQARWAEAERAARRTRAKPPVP